MESKLYDYTTVYDKLITVSLWGGGMILANDP